MLSLLEQIRSFVLKVGGHYSCFGQNALLWCKQHESAHHYDANQVTNSDLLGRSRFNSETYHNFIGIRFCVNHRVAMYATPSGDVVQCTRIRAPNLEYVTRTERFDTILRANNWHRAQQSSRIQKMAAHMYH